MISGSTYKNVTSVGTGWPSVNEAMSSARVWVHRLSSALTQRQRACFVPGQLVFCKHTSFKSECLHFTTILILFTPIKPRPSVVSCNGNFRHFQCESDKHLFMQISFFPLLCPFSIVHRSVWELIQTEQGDEPVTNKMTITNITFRPGHNSILAISTSRLKSWSPHPVSDSLSKSPRWTTLLAYFDDKLYYDSLVNCLSFSAPVSSLVCTLLDTFGWWAVTCRVV